jgi:hypothetical protein
VTKVPSEISDPPVPGGGKKSTAHIACPRGITVFQQVSAATMPGSCQVYIIFGHGAGLGGNHIGHL